MHSSFSHSSINVSITVHQRGTILYNWRLDIYTYTVNFLIVSSVLINKCIAFSLFNLLFNSTHV